MRGADARPGKRLSYVDMEDRIWAAIRHIEEVGGVKRRNIPMTVARCKLDVSNRKRIVAGI